MLLLYVVITNELELTIQDFASNKSKKGPEKWKSYVYDWNDKLRLNVFSLKKMCRNI